MNDSKLDDNTVWAIMAACILLPIGLGAGWLSRSWQQAGSWLVRQRILAAGPDVVVAIPGLGQVGLDGFRLAAVAGGLVLLGGLVIGDRQRRRRAE